MIIIITQKLYFDEDFPTNIGEEDLKPFSYEATVYTQRFGVKI
ncbi:hypothetical protein [Nostoc sp. UCD121]|nr:hypothetical protein [Nostoc sp. UCD121]